MTVFLRHCRVSLHSSPLNHPFWPLPSPPAQFNHAGQICHTSAFPAPTRLRQAACQPPVWASMCTLLLCCLIPRHCCSTGKGQSKKRASLPAQPAWMLLQIKELPASFCLQLFCYSRSLWPIHISSHSSSHRPMRLALHLPTPTPLGFSCRCTCLRDSPCWGLCLC